MKLLIILLSILTFNGYAQKPNPDYDSTLVKKFQADERGMRNYILVILKTGPADSLIKGNVRDSLFRSHFSNIGRLAKEGKLIIAGPIEKNEHQYRGIFILTVTSFEEARSILQNDATVSNKIFELEMFEWYGSAALPVYLETDKKLRRYAD